MASEGHYLLSSSKKTNLDGRPTERTETQRIKS
jgi:hypothetical protein